jgi:hypothetical protein
MIRLLRIIWSFNILEGDVEVFLVDMEIQNNVERKDCQ